MRRWDIDPPQPGTQRSVLDKHKVILTHQLGTADSANLHVPGKPGSSANFSHMVHLAQSLPCYPVARIVPVASALILFRRRPGMKYYATSAYRARSEKCVYIIRWIYGFSYNHIYISST